MRQDQAVGTQAANRKVQSVLNAEFAGGSLESLAFSGAIDKATLERVLEQLTFVVTDGVEMSPHDLAYNTRIKEARRVISEAAKMGRRN